MKSDKACDNLMSAGKYSYKNRFHHGKIDLI